MALRVYVAKQSLVIRLSSKQQCQFTELKGFQEMTFAFQNAFCPYDKNVKTAMFWQDTIWTS